MVSLDEATNIRNFLMRIHGNYEGYAFTTRRDGDSFHPQPFQSPANRQRFSVAINALAQKSDTYFSPALFKTKEGHNTKNNFVQTKWLWIDIDGGNGSKALASLKNCPKPSIINQTSPEGNFHCFWELDEPCDDADLVERANKSIVKSMPLSDQSSWDVGQLLRIPGTFNHKHNPPFQILTLEDNGLKYNIREFPMDFSDMDLNIEVELDIDFENLPLAENVLKTHNIPRPTLEVLATAEPSNRSDALYKVGLDLIEYVSHITDSEVYSVLEAADNKWGKYKDAGVQRKELCRIILKGRQKITLRLHQRSEGMPMPTIRELQFLFKAKPTFIYNDFIPYKGLVLLFGPPGLGKTYFALNIAAGAVAKESFLGFDYNENVTVNPFYLTMEMSEDHTTQYLTNIASNYEKEAHEHVLSNMRGVNLPSSINLWDTAIQAEFEAGVRKNNVNFIIIDSISTSGGEGDHTGKYYDFIDDVLRRKLGCTVILIGHDRKPPQDTPRKVLDINDALGSRLHTSRPDTVIGIDRIKNTNNAFISSLKIRQGQGFEPFVTERTLPYRFARVVEEKKEAKDDNKSTDPRFSP